MPDVSGRSCDGTEKEPAPVNGLGVNFSPFVLIGPHDVDVCVARSANRNERVAVGPIRLTLPLAVH